MRKHVLTKNNCEDPFRWLNRGMWQRVGLLRAIRSFLIRSRRRRVPSNLAPEDFWREAIYHAPFSFRYLGRSLTIEELECELGENPLWKEVRLIYRCGDRIWPFIVNPDTSEMRLGYVIVRSRKGVGGIITVVS